MMIVKKENLKDIILIIMLVVFFGALIYFFKQASWMNIIALNAQPISGKNISRIIPDNDKINYKIIHNYDDYINFVNLIMNNENSLDNFSYRQIPMEYTIDTYIDTIGGADFFEKNSLVAIDFFEENSDIFFNDIVIWSVQEKENIATIKAYRKNDESYILENDVEQIVFVAISKDINKISLEYIEDIEEINKLEETNRNTYVILMTLLIIIWRLLERKNKLRLKKSYIISCICTLLVILLVFLMFNFVIRCF